MVNDSADFNTLKELLGVTDGNLASHTRALEAEEYITIEKSFIGRKTNTAYKVTEKGREAFQEHLNALEKIIRKLADLSICPEPPKGTIRKGEILTPFFFIEIL